MLENVVKRSEFVYTSKQRYTKVIYYYYDYYVFTFHRSTDTSIADREQRSAPVMALADSLHSSSAALSCQHRRFISSTRQRLPA